MSTTPKTLWLAFTAAHPEHAGADYEAWHFCETEKEADELADLACRRIKQATCGLAASYEFANEAPPEVGSFHIVTDWRGRAHCIIRFIKIWRCRFDEVDADFAYREGEGDRSLDYWRRAHRWFFQNFHGGPADFVFTDDMEVVCEEFETVWPEQQASDPM